MTGKWTERILVAVRVTFIFLIALFIIMFIVVMGAGAESDQQVYLPLVSKFPVFRETVIVDPTPGAYPQDTSMGVWVLTDGRICQAR